MAVQQIGTLIDFVAGQPAYSSEVDQNFADIKSAFNALVPSSNTINIDTILEATAAAGVTIDGVLCKDGAVVLGTALTGTELLRIGGTGAPVDARLRVAEAVTIIQWPKVDLEKTGGTIASPGGHGANSPLGEHRFWGHDGTALAQGASIKALANTAWGVGDHPTNLELYVCGDGSATVNTGLEIDGVAGFVRLANTVLADSAGDQLLSTRKTGWTAATGTPTRTTFDTSTVTLPQLAERVKALLDDLISHGVIGT